MRQKKIDSKAGFSIFALTFRISRVLTEHIDWIYSLDSKLQILSISSVRILNILEVITKTNFSKIAKYATLLKGLSAPSNLEMNCQLEGHASPVRIVRVFKIIHKIVLDGLSKIFDF